MKAWHSNQDDENEGKIKKKNVYVRRKKTIWLSQLTRPKTYETKKTTVINNTNRELRIPPSPKQIEFYPTPN